MIEIRTGSRLHFGLMELCEGAEHRFAGLGLAIESPCIALRIGSEQELESVDKSCENISSEVMGRVARFFEQTTASESADRAIPQGLSVRIVSAPTMHSGLGVGTQLGCSLAVAAEFLRSFEQLSTLNLSSWTPVSQVLRTLSNCEQGGASIGTRCWDSQVLAAKSGRGSRSAVGLHSFLHGGLVMDSGYQCGVCDARPVHTQSVLPPEHWRIVLLNPGPTMQVSGEQESLLMSKLGSTRNEHLPQMLSLAEEALVSARTGNFERFVSTLESYMHLASLLFEGVQGGRYNGDRVAAAVAAAQTCGLRGVGQSSWGPTVFGISPTESEAIDATKRLQERYPETRPVIVRICDTGALCRTQP